MGGCNCGKRKNQVINNLRVPAYVDIAIQLWNEIKDIPFEDITEDMFNEMYRVYGIIYPNSRGLPERTEIVKIIHNITQYKNK
jgi:fructosamine-3-kinase